MIRLHRETAARLLCYLMWVRDQRVEERPIWQQLARRFGGEGFRPRRPPFVVRQGVGGGIEVVNAPEQPAAPAEPPPPDPFEEFLKAVFEDIYNGNIAPNLEATPLMEDITLLYELAYPDVEAPSLDLNDDDDEPKPPTVEGSLIDEIADVLMSPYTRNVLDGGTVKALRKAVLMPEESGGLVEKLKKRELYCIKCGGRFTRGEAVVLRMEPYDNRPIPVFYCVRCIRPDYFPCDTPACEERVAFPSGIFKRGHFCGVCTAKKKSGETTTATTTTGRVELGLENDLHAWANPIMNDEGF